MKDSSIPPEKKKMEDNTKDQDQNPSDQNTWMTKEELESLTD